MAKHPFLSSLYGTNLDQVAYVALEVLGVGDSFVCFSYLFLCTVNQRAMLPKPYFEVSCFTFSQLMFSAFKQINFNRRLIYTYINLHEVLFLVTQQCETKHGIQALSLFTNLN